MRLLILGESDSKGGGLSDRSLAWGELTPIELERRLGVPVESVHVHFYTHGANCLEDLETHLEAEPYDAILWSITSIGFTLLSVDNRVRRLLGQRAGDWFKQSRRSFDKKTKARARSGIRRRFNKSVHTVARNVIGQEPIASYDYVLNNHLSVSARLARLEDTDVLLLGPTDHGGELARLSRRTQPQVELFRQAMREEAHRRRFLWLDRQALSLADKNRDGLFTDGLHKGPELHRKIAEGAVVLLVARQDAAVRLRIDSK